MANSEQPTPGRRAPQGRDAPTSASDATGHRADGHRADAGEESDNLAAPAKPAGEERWRRICELAYARAEGRGFAPGGEVEDWLAAEREFDAGGRSPND